MCGKPRCARLAVRLMGALGVTLAQMAAGAEAADKDKPTERQLSPHQVGWWKFDDPRGKTALDSSKHRRNGVFRGGLSFEDNSVRGRVGKALKLDGKEAFSEAIP